MRKIFNGYSLVVRPFIAIGADVIEDVVSRGVVLNKRPDPVPVPSTEILLKVPLASRKGMKPKAPTFILLMDTPLTLRLPCCCRDTAEPPMLHPLLVPAWVMVMVE